MMKRYTRVAFAVATLALLYPAIVEAAVEDLRKIYEASLVRITTEHKAKSDIIPREYAKGLEQVAQQAQKSGKLELLMAVKAEQKRLADTKKILRSANTDYPQALAQLREKCRLAGDAIELDRCRAVVKLTGQYIAHLEKEKSRHTMDGAIEDALAAKAEIERVRESPPYKSAQFAVADAEASVPSKRPTAGVPPAIAPPNAAVPTYSLQWGGPMSGASVIVKGPAGQKLFSMSHESGNKLAGDRLNCYGGRTEIDGVAKELLAACKESNELTLRIGLRVSDREQSGPARILSFSFDGLKRNFSLCQERDMLLLRLRTTKTGLNGSSPEVPLTQIDPRSELTELVVTYRPGELLLFVDGQRTDVPQISGDFSNWEEYQLVLGNEWKDDRPWKGRIFSFAISNRFTERP